MGKIFVLLLSSPVGGRRTFSARFTLMADTHEVPSLLARSGKISHEGSGKGGCLVGIDACSRTLVGLVVLRTTFIVSTLIAPPRKRNDPSSHASPASLRLSSFSWKGMWWSLAALTERDVTFPLSSSPLLSRDGPNAFVLFYKSQETVLEALRSTRTLFLFPIVSTIGGEIHQ